MDLGLMYVCQMDIFGLWARCIIHDDVIKWKHFPRYWPFGEFPAQRPVTRSFYVFFDLRLNERLSKQWRGWWFETLSHPLWRHRNVGGVWLQLLRWVIALTRFPMVVHHDMWVIHFTESVLNQCKSANWGELTLVIGVIFGMNPSIMHIANWRPTKTMNKLVG